jgi:GMP synthase-like glutamine amidotransferase
MLKIHCLQHVPYEGLAIIQEWALRKGHELRFTRFYEKCILPGIEEIDWLVIMGGPMGVNDHDKFPWLAGEIEFIRKAIDNSKVVIGICLGAQLIARSLGAAVKQGKHKEIGWFPVVINKNTADEAGFDFLPDKLTAFHWHQDTFDIPAGAFHLASSEVYSNQAFIFNGSVLALQFHFEMDLPAIKEIIRNSGGELAVSAYVQPANEIITAKQHIANNNKLMRKILDRLDHTS